MDLGPTITTNSLSSKNSGERHLPVCSFPGVKVGVNMSFYDRKCRENAPGCVILDRRWNTETLPKDTLLHSTSSFKAII